ncbi:MAG: hypothetical protein ACTHOE_12445 [Conexibacter sp.]
MLVLATAVGGCGNAGSRSAGGTTATAPASATKPSTQARPPPRPANDVARAEAALIRLADMPSREWSQQSGNVTRLHCGSFEPFAGARALVRSRRLTQDHAGVQERIALYRSPAAAAHALRRLDSRIAANCLRHELRRHVSEESGAPAGPAELVRAEPLGPTANARRYTSTSVSQYGKVVGYIDAVHARVGRALAALVIVSGPAPPDEALYNRVVALVTRRLNATLG